MTLPQKMPYPIYWSIWEFQNARTRQAKICFFPCCVEAILQTMVHNFFFILKHCKIGTGLWASVLLLCVYTGVCTLECLGCLGPLLRAGQPIPPPLNVPTPAVPPGK